MYWIELNSRTQSVFLFLTEFNVTSFCRDVGPLSYSRMKILRLDGNKVTYHQLPADWVYCLRVLQKFYIWLHSPTVVKHSVHLFKPLTTKKKKKTKQDWASEFCFSCPTHCLWTGATWQYCKGTESSSDLCWLDKHSWDIFRKTNLKGKTNP